MGRTPECSHHSNSDTEPLTIQQDPRKWQVYVTAPHSQGCGACSQPVGTGRVRPLRQPLQSRPIHLQTRNLSFHSASAIRLMTMANPKR